MANKRDAPRCLHAASREKSIIVSEHGIPKILQWLGYASVVPFVAGVAAFIIVSPKLHGFVLYSLLTYASVALAFQGAVHCGLALRDGVPASAGQLLVSVLPLLVGWGALALPPDWAFQILIGGFVLLGVGDVLMSRSGLAPPWYPRFRLPLTAITVASLFVSALLV